MSGCAVATSDWETLTSDRNAATPRPGIATPRPDGASNLSDVPLLTKGAGRRHVILMIGDGMQLASEVAASRYLYGVDRGLGFHGFPERAFATTWDVDVYNARASALTNISPYSAESYDPRVGYDPAIGGDAPYPILTEDYDQRHDYLTQVSPDSASTGTAMSTGIKTYASAIAWRPEVDAGIETSPELLRRFYGMSIGFVTTVPLSHATPATFFAHNKSRWNNVEIARELFTDTRPDVMIGGGWRNSGYYADADLDQLVASGKYVLVHREDGVDGNQSILAAAVQAKQAEKRLIGLFGEGAGNFLSPVPVDSPGNPEVKRGALESPSLANASVAALEVLARDPEGFFLLVEQGDIDWANHSHDYGRMVGCVSDLDAAVRSVVAFIDRPSDDLDWTNTTLIVTADHANGYLRFVQPLFEGDLPLQDGSSYPDGEITYGATWHTSELVTVYAKGYAAAKLHDYETPYPGLGIIDDTSIYRLVLDAARR